jgi:hypothetical protein
MHNRALVTILALPIVAFAATVVFGQDKGSVDPKPLPPLANPNDPKLGAKELFGRTTSPAPLATHSIGFYAKGCLAGAVALPINGETWQVMRLSRNRNWAHPDMVALLERLSVKKGRRVRCLCAHLKHILRLGRLRVRGPCGARDDFLLAATAQNLRKLMDLIPLPVPNPARVQSGLRRLPPSRTLDVRARRFVSP